MWCCSRSSICRQVKLMQLRPWCVAKWPEYKSPLVLFERASAERATGRLGRPIREVAVARAAGQRLFLNVHPDELSSPLACQTR